MVNGKISGKQYGFSGKWWMQSNFFNSWLKKKTIYQVCPSQPTFTALIRQAFIALLSRNHQFCRREWSDCFCSPPNTTHLTQPLDKGVFGPFKIHWRHVCHDFLISHPGKVVNEKIFCSLLSKARLKSMTTVNTVAGFQTTGIYPVNREAIQLPGESSSEAIIAPQPIITPFK